MCRRNALAVLLARFRGGLSAISRSSTVERAGGKQVVGAVVRTIEHTPQGPGEGVVENPGSPHVVDPAKKTMVSLRHTPRPLVRDKIVEHAHDVVGW